MPERSAGPGRCSDQDVQLQRGKAASPRTVALSLARTVVRALDGLYLAFQGVLKTYGLVAPDARQWRTLSHAGEPVAILPSVVHSWPELRVPLPRSAAYWYSVESMCRRGQIWRSPQASTDVVAWLSEALPCEFWLKRRKSRLSAFTFVAGGVENIIRVVELASGETVIGVGQKIHAIRYEEAERALMPLNRGALQLAEPESDD